MKRSKRELSGLERALWRSVTQDVERIEIPKGKPAPRGMSGPKGTPKAPEMPSTITGPTGGLDRLTAKLSRSGAAASKPKAQPSKRPRVLPPSYAPPQSRAGGAPKPTAKHAPGALEARTRRRLNRGQAEPDARIDLHGMRQAGAHEALRSFILASRARGHRLVLVVTGKGEQVGTPARLAANEGRGVIRRAVPRWLALPDMAPHVLGHEPAARRHGGEGALYVRLKR